MELTVEQRALKIGLKRIILSDAHALTFSWLENIAHKFAEMLHPDLSMNDIEIVVADLTAEFTVTLSPSGSVVDPVTFSPWLEARKPEIETSRWIAYEELLISRDWEEPVIRELAKQSDEIVELLGDPQKPGTWARRGLLMGEVQSGKTANYIGVLNKALDYGYKVLIVIGGHTNELRKQTQSRFDSDLLGIDSEYIDDNIANVSIPRIGIGAIDKSLKANVMTTVRGDFSAKKKTAGITWITSDVPTVFIIKKNAKLIENVANYIKLQAGADGTDIPLVVIDDEADWGTPNTGSETDPTRVNKEIRKLLDVSKRSSYLGITATPFANIFIDHEASSDDYGVDLFPSDFIRVLPAPSNYFGISQYFAPTHSALRMDVDDCITELPILHKSSHVVSQIPESMRSAVASFMIGTAIRRLRQNKVTAASMLINVSRFNAVQEQIRDLVGEWLGELTAIVRTEFGRKTPIKSLTYKWLENLWLDEFSDVGDFGWDEVQSALVEIINDFRHVLVNSKTASERKIARNKLTSEERKAEDLLPTIFVGGDVLSRGITLEGLQVSYFVREPRTMDTLMQMGRWFGYRPAYSDLVRIWLPMTTAEDFSWSASVTQELREMLFEMRSRQLTPRQFGLRVRTHPEGFRIVAINKSKSTDTKYEGAIVYEDCFKESWQLSYSPSQRTTNKTALTQFLGRVTEMSKKSSGDIYKQSQSGYPLWQGVPLEQIQLFLMKFKGHQTSMFFGPGPEGRPGICFDAAAEAKGAEFWDVALVSGDGPTADYLPGLSGPTTVRNQLKVKNAELLEIGNRKVASAGALVSSFSAEEYKEFLEFKRASPYADHTSGQAAALAFIKRPRLLLFGLTVESGEIAGVALGSTDPLIAIAVAFPKLEPEEAIIAAQNARRYSVNSVWLKNAYSAQFEGDDLFDEDEES
jgi:hypothetical protein